ncbi:DUF192 domain-containing protein [Candidatus Roizmanbacteria bacterium]|nr:DUF192 domain-containing protein [Candidatus Roizmanbacteria bacterium]
MKKTRLLLSGLILIIAGVFVAKSTMNLGHWNGYRLTGYTLDNKRYKFAVAENEKQYVQGLMFVKKPLPIDGMLFVFPDKKYRTFWNRNTHLPLILYWLLDDKVVGKNYLPAIDESKIVFTIESPAPVNKVVEFIK